MSGEGSTTTMRTVTATYAKRNFLVLLHDVANGDPVVITRYGKPAAIFQKTSPDTPAEIVAPSPREDEENAVGGEP